MFANVEINVASAPAVIVPADAVLDSGRDSVVFVARGEGHFEPRRVKVGRRTPDGVEIVDGVREGEQVATSAGFFLDSESQLRGSLDSYRDQPRAPAAAAPVLAIEFHTDPDPPAIGENEFTVTLKNESGAPVSGADVTVQLFMPAMPTMNMPAMKNDIRLPAAGKGLYRGSGQVLSAGRWDVTVTVAREGGQLQKKQLTLVTR
jgi:hypothetical protein